MSNQTTEIVPAGESGVARQDYGGEIVRGTETAMAAMAAQSKALVEARFLVAMRNTRKWENIRVNVNRLCKDPGFASEALYVKPLTQTPGDWSQIDKRERLRRRIDGEVKDWPMGFSIRAIEAILFECGNFDCDATIIWEDADKRLTVVSVIDLERNSAYRRTVTTQKTVERSYLKKGEEPIAVRNNTNGQLVYIVAANPQQVDTSEAAGVSKALRTLGERLLPPHFKAEWRRIIEQTIVDQAAKDPEAAKKVLIDNFADKGVAPSQLEAFVGHPLDALQPAELALLRKIYVALSNSEITWRDVMDDKAASEGGEKAEPTTGAQKVKEALNRKREAPAPAATKPQPQPQAQAAQEPAAKEEAPKPQATPAQPTSEAPAAAADTTSVPANLPNLEEWPDDPQNDFYRVKGIVYRWSDERGSYRQFDPDPAPAAAAPKPEPVKQTPAAPANPTPINAKGGFNFRRPQ